MRKAGSLAKPVVEIKQDGDYFIIKTTTTFKTSEIKFKLGEEFDETRMDGSSCKVSLLEQKKMQLFFVVVELILISFQEFIRMLRTDLLNFFFFFSNFFL